jgi:WD40 repeat protein
MAPPLSNDSHSQVIVSPYRVSSESVRISEQQPFSFKSKAMDVILCCLNIDPNLIAVGSKDGSLIFYDRNGNVVKAHQNIHKSPVCTLALVNDGQFLASGSDHPNPEIILWNINSINL